jgi:hypothetical protein
MRKRSTETLLTLPTDLNVLNQLSGNAELGKYNWEAGIETDLGYAGVMMRHYTHADTERRANFMVM